MLTLTATTKAALPTVTVPGAAPRGDDAGFADLLAMFVTPAGGGEAKPGGDALPDEAKRDGQDDADTGKTLPDGAATLPIPMLALPVAPTLQPVPTPRATNGEPVDPAPIAGTASASLPIQTFRPAATVAIAPTPKSPPVDPAAVTALPSTLPAELPDMPRLAPASDAAVAQGSPAPSPVAARDLSITEAITAVADTVARKVTSAVPRPVTEKPDTSPAIMPMPSRFATLGVSDASSLKPASRAVLAGTTSPTALSIAPVSSRDTAAVSTPAAPRAKSTAGEPAQIARLAPVATPEFSVAGRAIDKAPATAMPAAMTAEPREPIPAVSMAPAQIASRAAPAPQPSSASVAPAIIPAAQVQASVVSESVMARPVTTDATTAAAATPAIMPAAAQPRQPMPEPQAAVPQPASAPAQPQAIDPRVGAPVVQAAARPVSGAAMRPGAARAQATDDSQVMPTIPQAATVALHTAATAPTDAAPLDMTRSHWPAAMIERIEHVRDALNAVDTRIRLAPDALGSIDLSVKTDGDTVHVHFNADQAATRAMIADAQPRLAEIAEQRGLKLGQTSVSGDAGGAAQQWSDQRRQPQPGFVPQRPASSHSTTDDAGPTGSDARIA